MISGYDILCFAPGPWDDIWRNRHQIMTRLARANRILYIEPWPYLHPTLRALKRGEVRWDELRGPTLRTVSAHLHVYRPALWAPRASGALAPLSQVAYDELLRRVIRQLGFQRPLLWLFLPDMQVFVGRYHEQLVIYHAVDEYAGYAGVSAAWRPVMQSMEEALVRCADMVFVTSPALFERKKAWNDHVTLVANGVDYDGFQRALAASTAVPGLIGIEHPIAGYVGAINDKVDLGLLCRVADELRDWSLLLVGPVNVTAPANRHALQALQQMPNVRLLGARPVHEVPHYIGSCDVCLLPYHMNEWTRHIDSLKLYEYLACGKPVVATAIPAARQFEGVVRIATDEEQFVAQIGFALYDNSPAQRLKRESIAAQNTWEHRVELLSQAIQGRLLELQRARGELLEREA